MNRTNSTQQKQTAVRNRILSLLKAFTIIFIIFVLLYVFARLLSEKTDITSADAKGAMEYIYEIDASSVLDTKPCGGNIAILTAKQILYVNRTGVLICQNEHDFSDPAMCAKDDSLLLYDRGGTAYRIERNGHIETEGEAAGAIFTAALDKKSFALALRGKDSLSSLMVYNKAAQTLYRWACASEYLVSVSFSKNGKKIAAVGVNAEKADLYSKVYVIDWNSPDPPEEYAYDSALFTANFLTGKTLAVMGETSLTHIADGQQKPLAAFPSLADRLTCFDEDSRCTAVLLAQYANDHSAQLLVFDKKGEQIFTKTFGEPVSAITCSDKQVSVAFARRIETYNYSGKLVGSISFKDNISSMTLHSGSLYVLFSNGLSVYSPTQVVEIPAPELTKESHPSSTTAPIEGDTSSGAPIAAFTDDSTALQDTDLDNAPSSTEADTTGRSAQG